MRGAPASLHDAIETGGWPILADVPAGRFGGAAAVADGRQEGLAPVAGRHLLPDSLAVTL